MLVKAYSCLSCLELLGSHLVCLCCVEGAAQRGVGQGARTDSAFADAASPLALLRGGHTTFQIALRGRVGELVGSKTKTEENNSFTHYRRASQTPFHSSHQHLIFVFFYLFLLHFIFVDFLFIMCTFRQFCTCTQHIQATVNHHLPTALVTPPLSHV